MIKISKTAAFGAIAALAIGVSGAAQAAPVVYASGSNTVVLGTNAGINPARSDIANAYGATNSTFYSLGINGSAVFTFLPALAFRSPGAVIEVTNGGAAYAMDHPESMDIYGVLAGVETLIGQVTNAVAANVFTFVGKFDSLKVVDTSDGTKSFDGYDINSISVTPAAIPLPAGGLLLLGALGGVAALRRRKSV